MPHEKSLSAPLRPAPRAGQRPAAGRLPAGPGRAGPQSGRSPCPGVQHLRCIGSRACRFRGRRRRLSHRRPEHRRGAAGAEAGLSHRGRRG